MTSLQTEVSGRRAQLYILLVLHGTNRKFIGNVTGREMDGFLMATLPPF